MDQHPVSGALPAKKETVSLEGTFRGKYRGFAVFLICCGFLLAAFAVSAVWMKSGGADGLHGWGSFWNPRTEEETTEAEPPASEESDSTTDTTVAEEESTAEEPMPEGATPIRTMDLTCPSLGTSYIHNETIYKPNVADLLTMDLSRSASTENPLVLILHTHTSESYLPTGTSYITETPGDLTHSRDEAENVVAVGAVLCRVLNEKGITAIHCTVMHDEPTYSGSYDRSEATIRQYLEMYPTIEYVIDLHRDAIMTSDGAFVRAATEENGEAVAQVMAVIGTDGNGTHHENWEENLALALQLRELLNADGAAVCRPVSLRNASYHQELAKHSLLLEVGTGANSLEEAKRAAVLVGEALAELIQSR